MKHSPRNIFFITLVCFGMMPQTTYAWGDGIPGAIVGNNLAKIDELIKGTLLGAIKTAAVTSIARQVDKLVLGTGVGAGVIIRNYDDYLREQPTLQAKTHVYNFLTRTYRGIGSTNSNEIY